LTKASITNKNCLAKNVQKYKHLPTHTLNITKQLVTQFNTDFGITNTDLILEQSMSAVLKFKKNITITDGHGI